MALELVSRKSREREDGVEESPEAIQYSRSLDIQTHTPSFCRHFFSRINNNRRIQEVFLNTFLWGYDICKNFLVKKIPKNRKNGKGHNCKVLPPSSHSPSASSSSSVFCFFVVKIYYHLITHTQSRPIVQTPSQQLIHFVCAHKIQYPVVCSPVYS
jgi:hypothetical protein